MNRIVLIGNGFDLAHGLKTSYADFINWYWDQRLYNIIMLREAISADLLCSLIILPNSGYKNWYLFSYQNSFFKDIIKNEWRVSGKEFIEELKNNSNYFEIKYSPFFERIIKSIETKGWVDIENEYYNLLTEYTVKDYSENNITSLNKQLQYLQERLTDYLILINQQEVAVNSSIKKKIYSPIRSEEVSIEATKVVKDYVDWWLGQQQITWEQKLYSYGITGINNSDHIYEIEKYKKNPEYYTDYPSTFMLPDIIMLLSFNYTKTAQQYLMKDKHNFVLNYIHGKVDDPRSVIFGYGDEIDDNYKRLQKLNNNECLSNIKTIKYQESVNYRSILSVIESAPYQVCVMGHSCGNSDRTLLNTLFEHKNCISIKPYYYKKNDGTDNYLELVQNISRNFTDMKLMRDRVVNKTYCETLTD